MAKSKKALSKIGKELKENEPKVVARTRQKKGKKAAQAQKTAILLSKARKAGVKFE